MTDGPRGRILVTGGAGFIGSWFVRRWLREGRGPVWNLDKLTYAGCLDSLFEAKDHPDHHFIHGDIADAAVVRQAIAQSQPDYVVHMAAESHVDRSIETPAPFVETNVQGAHILLDEALLYWRELPGGRRDAFRFLNVSTDEVYGSADPEESFSETACFAPNSPYAATKAGAAHLARAYHRTYGLPVITSLASNNYGPGQHPEKLIPLAILSAIANRPIPVFGDGRQERDWIHVDDHCAALFLLLTRGRPGELYNVGASHPLSNRDLLARLLDLVDNHQSRNAGESRKLLQLVEDRPGHDRRYALDCSRLQELGWNTRVSLESGLESAILWYASHSDWLANFDAAEYHKRRGRTRATR